MTTYVKELLLNGESPLQRHPWPLPTQDGPGAWVEADTSQPLERCGNGLHAYAESQVQTELRADRAFWEIEYADPPTDWGDKVSGYKARLVRPYQLPAWLASVQPAIDGMKDISWLQPDGNPDPAWRLFPTWDDARNAVRSLDLWDALRVAAWNAGWKTAWKAGRGNAWSSTSAAARNAAQTAAWKVARDAAEDAAWHAIRNAVDDAALWVQMTTVCADLSIDARHRDYVEARMNAWRKGYGVLAEVNGGLYVYERLG